MGIQMPALFHSAPIQMLILILSIYCAFIYLYFIYFIDNWLLILVLLAQGNLYRLCATKKMKMLVCLSLYSFIFYVFSILVKLYQLSYQSALSSQRFSVVV